MPRELHPSEENNPEDKFEAIEPGLVQRIEALNLDVGQKGDILLVGMGIKPSAWIGFDAKIWHEGENPDVIKTEEDIENFYNIIQKSRLSFEILPRKVKTERQSIQKKKINVYHDSIEVLIGANDNVLEELSQALKSQNHELIGKALGIPETAVEAFTQKRKRLNLYTIPKEELRTDSFLFSPTLTFSADNWQNEIQEGKKRAEAIRSISHRIYKEMVQNALKTYGQMGLFSDKTRKKWSDKKSKN